MSHTAHKCGATLVQCCRLTWPPLPLCPGFYDAGDHLKLNFPLATSLTFLAWGALEFREAYTATSMIQVSRAWQYHAARRAGSGEQGVAIHNSH